MSSTSTEQVKETPSLRYAEFSEPWADSKVGTFTKSSAFGPRFSSSFYSPEGTVATLRTTDMDNEGAISYDKIPLAEFEVGEFKEHYLEVGDLVVSRSGTIGVTGIFEGFGLPVVPGAFLIRFRLDSSKVCPRFVQLRFNSTKGRRALNKLAAGGVQKNLKGSSVLGMEDLFPALPEQRKIADFLTAVDGRIGQLSQKKALLEDYKKGVMQQLFTQAIRFKDDHGNDFPDWEQKTLGEVTKWASGGTPSKDNASFWEGDIPWMSAASMHERYYGDSPLRVTKEGVKSGSKMALKGTLLLLVRGSMLWNRIPVGITTRDVAFNQDVKALVPTANITVRFLLQWFIASENMLLHKVVGTGIGAGKLDTDEMKNLVLRLPSIAEQTKMGDFLASLDRKIESVATQITETQTFKRGLLQQMFV